MHYTSSPTKENSWKSPVASETLAVEKGQQMGVDEDQQIAYYTTWLHSEAERNCIRNNEKDIKAYRDESMQTTTIGNKQIQLFAPFRPQFSALQTFTRGQILAVGGTVLMCVLGTLLFHMGMIVTAIACITVVYLGDLLITVLLSVQTLNLSAEEQVEDALVHRLVGVDWPRYTILCPLYHEAEVVPQFVGAMCKMDYPIDKLQILFLTEVDDNTTRLAIQALHLPAHFQIVTVPDGKPRTKPRACNYGLLQATGDYIVIYDAEDIPDPLQLKKAVLAFANQGETTACIQAKLNFYNAEQNMLTRWFTAEYSLWFDLTLPGLQKLGIPLPLGGTSNHFRSHVLRSLGGWDAYNVTEDCDLGLRMAHYGFRTAVLDSTTYEEANPQIKNWIRQRSRWIKGYLQTYLVYMRRPQVYLQRERLGEFLALQLFVGGKTGVLFVNPLMWALVAGYMLFRPVDLYHTLFPGPILYMGALCLIFGNFFYTYSHLLGCMKRGHYHLVKWTLTIPIYWAMASMAAFMALHQLIFKPHYWEKTQHGFHLYKTGTTTKVTVITEEVSTGDSVTDETLRIATGKLIERLPATEQEFQVVSSSVSSNVMVTADEVDIEVTQKVVRVRRHTAALHALTVEESALKQVVISQPHLPFTESAEHLLETADSDDEVTIQLRAVQPCPPTAFAPGAAIIRNHAMNGTRTGTIQGAITNIIQLQMLAPGEEE